MEFYIYLICLGVGMVFTLLTAFFGHLFGHSAHVGGSGGHVEAGADSSDQPGVSIFSPTIMATFVTAFGGFGIIFHQIPATHSVFLSAPLSVACAVGISSLLIFILRKIFKSTQSSSESKVANLAGSIGHIITPIPANGVGEVAYVHGGSRYTAPAREEGGASVANGASVKIVRIVGSQLYVKAVAQ